MRRPFRVTWTLLWRNRRDLVNICHEKRRPAHIGSKGRRHIKKNLPIAHLRVQFPTVTTNIMEQPPKLQGGRSTKVICSAVNSRPVAPKMDRFERRGRVVGELAKTKHVVRNVNVADGNKAEFPPWRPVLDVPLCMTMNCSI